MKKVIITRGRHSDNLILQHLPEEVLSDIIIACHKGEGELYKETHKHVVKDIVEYEGNNVSEARHWCIVNIECENLLFIEDNIHFYKRGLETELGKPNKNKLYKLDQTHFNPETLLAAFKDLFLTIEQKLKSGDYALVGVSARGGNGHVEEDFQDNCRIYGCWAINKKEYLSINEKLTDVQYREDFYICLSLIRNAKKIGSVFNYAMEKTKGIGTKGGCSTYRTQEATDANAVWMAKEFHPFVVAVEKERNWEGYTGKVLDVRIQWKKMYDYYWNKENTEDLFSI